MDQHFVEKRQPCTCGKTQGRKCVCVCFQNFAVVVVGSEILNNRLKIFSKVYFAYFLDPRSTYPSSHPPSFPPPSASSKNIVAPSVKFDTALAHSVRDTTTRQRAFLFILACSVRESEKKRIEQLLCSEAL